jgi:hypothetical protein
MLAAPSASPKKKPVGFFFFQIKPKFRLIGNREERKG